MYISIIRSGGSRNFKNGGGGGGGGGGRGGGGGVLQRVIEFLESEKCFDAPQHIPCDFVVRVENKIHVGVGVVRMY